MGAFLCLNISINYYALMFMFQNNNNLLFIFNKTLNTNNMKVQILGRDIELKATFRAYIIFENITGKSFQQLSTLADVLTFFYATILGSAKVTDISFDDFLDFIDANPNVVTEFSEWMAGSNAVVEEASNNNVDKEDVKKKTSRKQKKY